MDEITSDDRTPAARAGRVGSTSSPLSRSREIEPNLHSRGPGHETHAKAIALQPRKLEHV